MPAYIGEEEVIKKNMALALEKTYTTEFVEGLSENVKNTLFLRRNLLMKAKGWKK